MAYQIKQGDTLGAIAQNQGTTIAELQKLNPTITDPNKIYAGQSLVIPADTLTSTTTPATIPTKVDNTSDFQNALNTGNATINALNTNKTTDENALTEYLKKLEKPASTAELYKTAKTEEGITEKETAVAQSQKELDVLKAQLQGITDTATAESLAMKGEGINQAGATARNITRERETAIRALPLQAQILAKQAEVTGNQAILTSAKENLNTYFKLLSDDATNEYKYEKDKVDAVYDYATKKEQQQLDAKKLEDEKAYTEKKTNLDLIQSWSEKAIDNGQSNLISQLSKLDPTSSDFATKLGAITSQIRAKETTTGNTVKSGALVIPESAISSGQQVLDSVKGEDGYVYTPKYLEMLDAWKADGGLEQDFFTNYPPKNYLNPNDASVPTYLRDKLKAVESREL